MIKKTLYKVVSQIIPDNKVQEEIEPFPNFLFCVVSIPPAMEHQPFPSKYHDI